MAESLLPMSASASDKPRTTTIAPLNLPVVSREKVFPSNNSIDLICLVCPKNFGNIFSDEIQKSYTKHILEAHKIVIGNVNLIADFKLYVSYWKEILNENNLKDFCFVIKTNTGPEDSKELSEDFYLLCDKLPEDRKLRENLHQQRLDWVLQVQQGERYDPSFSRMCLFCKKVFSSNKAELIDHVSELHNFTIGHPDNIVFVDEFLDVLEEKLRNLQCLFCENVFTSWEVLKEHMRKKQHKKVNPSNKAYDKFYVINYLEMGKNWEAIHNERDGNTTVQENDDEDWSDWKEDSQGVVCLFCLETYTDYSDLLSHLKKMHKFDFEHIIKSLNLTFYQKVKIVNYIRSSMHKSLCFVCEEKFDDQNNLLTHLKTTEHISEIPGKDLWDQPQYFFPTYENDTLLYTLEDDSPADDILSDSGDFLVIPESEAKANLSKSEMEKILNEC